MSAYTITFTLERDATFARGEGVAGFLDREVAHDAFGLPYLHGRTLKGLLAEEADNVIDALGYLSADLAPWQAARDALFGRPGSSLDGQGILHIGHAQLPENVRRTVASSQVQPADVLGALTAVRRQSAVDPTGLPRDNALRAMRVIMRRTPFAAEIATRRTLSEVEEGLLAAAVLAFRRAGTGRNRGRGELSADLLRDGRSILFERWTWFAQEAGL
ncbi:putative RAMP superfamily protein probably involved in DNA repair [Candidatus Promineifilum breve]|uniref:RAMP superfamily protein probably involved in DNA repair n=1 Tax=Candidatus Promineifilum breve TaxID=1806508 RepID=A0A160T5H5_9CHLR|nr:RAMP superfamily CRISPR-associated protein [Candidatus Promineifilum breve]CUS05062.2 putative RAMP superfamily protein probably involved in DNA repair [Candidatus Promineifilum breve]